MPVTCHEYIYICIAVFVLLLPRGLTSLENQASWRSKAIGVSEHLDICVNYFPSKEIQTHIPYYYILLIL